MTARIVPVARETGFVLIVLPSKWSFETRSSLLSRPAGLTAPGAEVGFFSD